MFLFLVSLSWRGHSIAWLLNENRRVLLEILFSCKFIFILAPDGEFGVRPSFYTIIERYSSHLSFFFESQLKSVFSFISQSLISKTQPWIHVHASHSQDTCTCIQKPRPQVFRQYFPSPWWSTTLISFSYFYTFNTISLDTTLTCHLTLRSMPKSNSDTCTRRDPATKSSPKPHQIWSADPMAQSL